MNLLLLKFYQKIYIYLLIVFLLHSFILWISTTFFINEIFKTRIFLDYTVGGMFFIKSFDQIFITCICFFKLLLTSEKKNLWHPLYKQWLYKCYKSLRRLHRIRNIRNKHKKRWKTKQLVFYINRWKMQTCINSYWKK